MIDRRVYVHPTFKKKLKRMAVEEEVSVIKLTERMAYKDELSVDWPHKKVKQRGKDKYDFKTF